MQFGANSFGLNPNGHFSKQCKYEFFQGKEVSVPLCNISRKTAPGGVFKRINQAAFGYRRFPDTLIVWKLTQINSIHIIPFQPKHHHLCLEVYLWYVHICSPEKLLWPSRCNYEQRTAFVSCL